MAISPNYVLAIGGGKSITIRSLCDVLPSNYIDCVSASTQESRRARECSNNNMVCNPHQAKPHELDVWHMRDTTADLPATTNANMVCDIYQTIQFADDLSVRRKMSWLIAVPTILQVLSCVMAKIQWHRVDFGTYKGMLHANGNTLAVRDESLYGI